jgi:putative FmdB family regulatory protein
MPLYEYQCKQCGHRFERIQSFSAPDEKECPVCHGEVERLISTPARPHFKGSGFYSTDYAAKPAASAKSGDGSSSSDGASAPSDKSGSDKGSTDKPAAKTESAPAPAAPSTSPSKSD